MGQTQVSCIEIRDAEEASAGSSDASFSALACATSADEWEDGTAAGTSAGRKDAKGEYPKRGINPFQHISIQGVKRLVGEHHHHHQLANRH